MDSLKFDRSSTLADIIKKITSTESEKITIVIDSDSPVLKNPLNYKILEKLAAEKGKEIELTELTPSGQIEEVPAQELEENLGFVEEGSDKEVMKEAQTAEEAVQEGTLASESETLELSPESDVVQTLGEDLPKFGIEPPDQPLNTSLPDEEVSREEGAAPGFLPIKGFKFPSLNFKNLKNFKFTRQRLLIGGGAVGFLLVVFILFYLLPSAQVTLYVAAQNLEKQATVTATPRLNDINVPSSSIPLTTVEVRESGSLSTKVFGKKNIGDPAKGKVTIRNYSTSKEKALPKGSTLRVVGKSPVVEFSLDRAVTVPSGTASSSIDSSGRQVTVVDPGRLDVESTASKIGTEGNISSGTRLAISNEGLDVVDAIAASDFSGGSSKEVTVVSAADRNNLLATLSAQLTDKAKEEVMKKLTDGQKLPDGGVETTEVKKVFSKDIDQEASDLNLNLEISAKASVYNEKDLAKLLVEILAEDVSEGYKISEKETEATA